MRPALLIFSCFLLAFVSCNKPNDLTSPPPAVVIINNQTPSPAPQESFVSMKLNGQPITFTNLQKSRSLAGKYFNFSASNDSVKLELKINSINQTGNSTGLILVGVYEWKIYIRTAENNYQAYTTTEQWLGLYSDKPLTDSIVSGNFNFRANIPGATVISNITDGAFRMVF